MAGHKPFHELVSKMSPDAQEKIKRGTARILAEIELRELRETLMVTQHDLAQRLKTTQAAISRLENTDQDPKVSTLRNYAKALGGELEVSVRLPDRTVRLANLLKQHKIAERETVTIRAKTKVKAGKAARARRTAHA